MDKNTKGQTTMLKEFFNLNNFQEQVSSVFGLIKNSKEASDRSDIANLRAKILLRKKKAINSSFEKYQEQISYLTRKIKASLKEENKQSKEIYTNFKEQIKEIKNKFQIKNSRELKEDMRSIKKLMYKLNLKILSKELEV